MHPCVPSCAGNLVCVLQASTPEAVAAAAATLQNVLLDKEAQYLVASLHGTRIITGLLQTTDCILLARAAGMGLHSCMLSRLYCNWHVIIGEECTSIGKECSLLTLQEEACVAHLMLCCSQGCRPDFRALVLNCNPCHSSTPTQMPMFQATTFML